MPQHVTALVYAYRYDSLGFLDTSAVKMSNKRCFSSVWLCGKVGRGGGIWSLFQLYRADEGYNLDTLPVFITGLTQRDKQAATLRGQLRLTDSLNFHVFGL